MCPPGLDFPAETARRLNESFVDNLIRLHRVDYSAVGLSDLGKPEGYLERQIRGWNRTLLRLQNARLSGSAENLRVDAAAHAVHERRFADSQ